MHRKNTPHFWLFGITLLLGFSPPNGSELKKADWLLGTWENPTTRGSVYEHWVKLNAREFEGKSYMLSETDTVVFETIRLVEEDGHLVYIPTVRDQNDSLPVRFRSTVVAEGKLVFENKAHDFPQVISYRQINPDSLVAEISGTKSGTEQRRFFPMRRVK
ncbi:MAG: DUF6265 family protein [Cryomorphaceae bacterium]